MKYAHVDGRRREAERGLSGTCPVCGSKVVPKCGEVRAQHWAHHRRSDCDHWWETETPWHRSWKNEFPSDWQEYVQRAEDGEKHIADVRTERGRVIEFQNSPITAEERRAREAFYGKMIWVVNGLRRQRDLPKFHKLLQSGGVVRVRPLTWFVPWMTECALLRDWRDSRVPVFFDFGPHAVLPGEPLRWCLSPKKKIDAGALLIPVTRKDFIVVLRRGGQLKGARVVNLRRSCRVSRSSMPTW